jgi:hypothetical protein
VNKFSVQFSEPPALKSYTYGYIQIVAHVEFSFVLLFLNERKNMGFVTYEGVKQLIPAIIRKKLDSVNVFEQYESAAAIIIRDETGVAVPASADDAPDWVTQPAAWIIAYLALSAIEGAMPEQLIQSVQNQYKEALRLLKQHLEAAPRTAAAAAIGTIDGLYLNEYEDL